MKFTIRQIANVLKGEIEGNAEAEITAFSPIENGKKGAISFLSNLKYSRYIYETHSSAVLVSKDFVPSKPVPTTLIKVDDPYVAITLLLEEYQKVVSEYKTGIEEPSYIGKNTKIGKNIHRGAFSYIGDNVTIGNNVKIYPHAYIGKGTIIGDNVTIFSGAKIYDKFVVIGNNCVIHSNAVVGVDGFGFAQQADSSYRAIPQISNVIIEDDVSIGAGVAVCCGAISPTIIRQGVKIGDLVEVAHNVEIGKDSIVISQAGISGSTKIGKNCKIGGQVGIAGHIKVGDDVNIGAKSGVMSNLENETTYLGSPAFKKREFLRQLAFNREVPDIKERIEKIEAILKEKF